jgi:hypothetical protein
MSRVFTLLLLAAAGAVLVWPFVMTSRALDEHGIALRGRVYHKSETVRVRDSTWDVNREITIEYTVPETGGVSFFDVLPDSEQYDGMRTHQGVELRYLLRRDVPKVPLSDILWQIHALPTVHLENPGGISRWHTLLTPNAVRFGRIAAGLAVLLILWRITRSTFLGWATVVAFVAALGALFVHDFPRPTPPPSANVKPAVGRVKSIGHIDKLFSGRRTRGMVADQPIDVVGVEFIPEGRTEPVIAVDLIDRGSAPNLKEGSTAPIRYEAQSPRTAYLEGGTRTFAERNFRGAILQGALYVGVLLGVLAVAQLIGRGFKRLVARPSKA